MEFDLICPDLWLPQNLPRRNAICSDSKLKKMVDYSTKKIGKNLLDELKNAIKNVRGWGSVEIYVQDFKVTQITERNIKKTSHSIKDL
ncbi:MAG: hypothetical protein UV73_C0001G0214 [Candidatus Gottesmanbacteria bacterium GW2011_GWA2_43_14]|uniref:DUF2292 domain-containing protein n=1 Tax=Candidatus Gottesmanbacteria bacterium GW2011_GWA2_43_14 TaxID=1618443 RepID=A0A0G1GIV1_9BACT|nr:MAG: hypothetical protein UV73_C0001G0214 [Candidatus Gottesmanbacteria bacterium GW2011_GWA2_43_14]